MKKADPMGIPGTLSLQPLSFDQWLSSIRQILPMLDMLPNVHLFVTDADGGLVAANSAFLEHHSLSRSQIQHGKNEWQLHLYGPAFAEQDNRVRLHRAPVIKELQAHVDAAQTVSWWHAYKYPVHDQAGAAIGMIGSFVALQNAAKDDPFYLRAKVAYDYIRDHSTRSVSNGELTELTALSVAQLEREFKRIFDLTPRQVMLKARFDHAITLLVSDRPIAQIGQLVGYNDHSAFTRQCKALSGFSPQKLRQALAV